MAGLEWKNLTYTIKTKGIHGTMEERIILDNITGSAKKGQLLAIMGPSGTYE
jgi:ABC-type transporter Mla maintaining outer membrane lipid asymmetry ATPase subunit MlaF